MPGQRRGFDAETSGEDMTMVKFPMLASKATFGRATARLLYGSAFLSGLLFAGCALEVQNAQQIAQLSKPPGSVYTGWRVFQDRCAVCHGPAATGTAGGPDLLPRVLQMGPRRFVSLVLDRYDWSLPAAKSSSESTAREALIDEVVQRKQGALTMPAWEGEPRVSAHIVDLYAYLSARAQGTQGVDRPAP
jgi:mono/diheme cytochrome c family protein